MSSDISGMCIAGAVRGRAESPASAVAPVGQSDVALAERARPQEAEWSW